MLWVSCCTNLFKFNWLKGRWFVKKYAIFDSTNLMVSIKINSKSTIDSIKKWTCDTSVWVRDLTDLKHPLVREGKLTPAWHSCYTYLYTCHNFTMWKWTLGFFAYSTRILCGFLWLEAREECNMIPWHLYVWNSYHMSSVPTMHGTLCIRLPV